MLLASLRWEVLNFSFKIILELQISLQDFDKSVQKFWPEWFKKFECCSNQNPFFSIQYKKSSDDLSMATREVKSFTDSIISNAETNGFQPIKRSFVEEARQKFSKWM